ncbi:MAG: hypothetical protein H0T46_12820 [Deltaproteobacteria bacterium]|nr:hypothetical protein [Deltaproteobacteria bacterium]
MRTLLFSVAIALAAPSLGCESKDSKSKVEHNLPEMSVDEVAAGLEAKTLTAVDCNSEKTRKKAGTLPGAILIEDEETFTASALPADKNTKLVFYCGGPG